MNPLQALTSCISLQNESDSAAQYCVGIIGFNNLVKNIAKL